MARRKIPNRLDFEALRHAIERCDLDLMLGFYAEVAKYLRAVFDQKMPHRVEREVVGEERVTFQEACEYPDGSRVVVGTTLELRDGKIVRQVDVVVKDAQTDSKEEIGQDHPYSKTHPGVDALPTGDL